MTTIIHQRVQACQDGSYEKCICKMASGWAVMGDVQFLEGYSLLLPDPVVPHLNAMSMEHRLAFLSDMTRLGDAVLSVTGAVRINYEMLGNLEPALHAHVFPRFDTEDEALRTKPVWFYDWENAPEYHRDEHLDLLQAIKLAVENQVV